MAKKIYLTGGAINIEGLFVDITSINQTAFDWQLNSNKFTVRDKIENQSYELGVIADIQDKNGVVFTSNDELILYLNKMMYPVGANSGLDIARGNVQGISTINKWGAAPSGIQTTATDIWCRADSVPTQQIWLAPTAARVHTLVSTSANDTCGAGTLTLTGQPLNTETVTIGTKVYTFQTVLTNVDGNVLIGATASDSLDNLIAAINLAAGAGTLYALATTAGANVVAVAGAGDTMLVYDKDSAGLATTETLTDGSWGASTITPGTGARKIRLYGLRTWDLKESYEDISLRGTSSINTVNSYVIIHRMKVIGSGATSPNVGTITATAATDGTVTAAILPNNGQTEMAIYGIPSTQKIYITRWRCNIDRTAGVATSADFELRVNEFPQVQPTIFLRKHDISLQSTGSNIFESTFDPPMKFDGPCIIKVQAIASAADLDGESSFDGYIVDN